MQCPECHGLGYYVAEVLDTGVPGGYPRHEQCGYCKSSGQVPRRLYFRILGWKSAQARKDRKQGADTLSAACNRARAGVPTGK